MINRQWSLRRVWTERAGIETSSTFRQDRRHHLCSYRVWIRTAVEERARCEHIRGKLGVGVRRLCCQTPRIDQGLVQEELSGAEKGLRSLYSLRSRQALGDGGQSMIRRSLPPISSTVSIPVSDEIVHSISVGTCEKRRGTTTAFINPNDEGQKDSFFRRWSTSNGLLRWDLQPYRSCAVVCRGNVTLLRSYGPVQNKAPPSRPD